MTIRETKVPYRRARFAAGGGRHLRVPRKLRRRERAEGYVQYAVLVTMALVVAVAVIAFGQTLVQLFGRLGQNLLGIGG